MSNIFHDIQSKGFVIINGFFQSAGIQHYRDLLDKYLDDNPSFRDGPAKIIPGFAGRTPELESLNLLHEDQGLMEILKDAFDHQDFIFLDHSDLHQNKSSGWHRDTKDYQRGGGNMVKTWDAECFIIKACILLQDHSDNKYGLWFQPETHMRHKKGSAVHADTQSTDLILFDQRILHKGQTKKPMYHTVHKQNRYLITYGYGLNNRHSQIHIAGAAGRQKRQRAARR